MRRFGQERKQLERYSPPEFFSSFVLSITKYDPIKVKEAIESTKGEL